MNRVGDGQGSRVYRDSAAFANAGLSEFSNPHPHSNVDSRCEFSAWKFHLPEPGMEAGIVLQRGEDLQVTRPW
jgi:hypothetical protein